MKSLGARAQGERLERMQASPMWAGQGFRNQYPVLPGLRDASVPRPSLGDFLKGGGRRAPEGKLPMHDPRASWAQRPETGLRATWLGHSSVLIEIGGLRVLTDPVFGPRASPSRLIGPKRFHPVPVRMRALGPLDLVVISHDHYDHLDLPTLLQLAKTPVPFVTSLGVGAHLAHWGIPPERIIELDWWQSWRHPRGDLEVTAAPSQHFSGRGLKDRNATLWSSMVLRSSQHRVFFSGDTGLTGEYAQIRERLGPFDLSLLEVGAFHPSWGDIHLGPDNALKAHGLLGGGALLPVHWGTFSLALHDWDQPVEVLRQQADPTRTRLLLPLLGQPVEPTRLERLDAPWWRAVQAPAGCHWTGEGAGPAAKAAEAEAGTQGDRPSRPPGSARIPWPLD